MQNSAAMLAEVLEIPKKRGEYGKGSCYQRPDNGRWEISFYDNEGRRRRKSFNTEAKAQKELAKNLLRKEDGTLDTPEGRTKIDTLADAYLLYIKNSKPKSYNWVKLTWNANLKPFFGGRVAARVGTDLFNEYIENRQADTDTDAARTSRNGTINRELAILKAMFFHGFNSEPPKVARVPKFPPRLRESNPRDGFIDEKQYQALQANCKHLCLRGMNAVAYTFGFRKSECMAMKVKQINLRARTISLAPGTTKNDKGRVVRMSDEVHDLLKQCIEGKRPEDAVFTWSDGSPVKDFRSAWDTMITAAKLPNLIFHDFRRSAVKNLIDAGVDRDIAKKISGHSTDSVFARYNIVNTDRLAEATEKLEISRKLATERSDSELQAVNG